MSNPYFQFKQFTVWHDKCAMKVGTDGVLLGAWTSVQGASRILDVGTGTGLVALMLAQRSLRESQIVALEIDEAAVAQAKENIFHSPWKDRIEVLQKDFIFFHSSDKFDVIVSNPPYFIDSLICPDQQRNVARHNDSLTYEELLKGVVGLLAKEGRFTIVIPTDVADRVKLLAMNYGMYAVRQLNVVTKPGGISKRTLICFSLKKQECLTEVLIIELSRHQYSEEYINLTREYYLNLK
ncbi:methyltransferase [Bacteroides sp.]|uniref:tRNA1(Val) (adenine(37)-N6)-methyltransferase n=1 Tax=Bacteroides sp. TaxID=29523 RepID=UPI00262C01CE|nr:methyltransferase [Bacteroides sp.]MDD3038589.1 methyltransferase [Bacteroides sp.]